MDYATCSDEQLAAYLRQGDVGALEALYDRHSASTFSLAVRMLGAREAAEDLVQECFLKLWRQPDSFDPKRGRLLVWLMGVVHHRAIDLLRRQSLEKRWLDQAILDGVANATAEDASVEALRNLSGERLLQAMAALPDEQRLVLELAYYGGFTHSQMSERLGAPLGTVKTQVRLAIRRLRKALDPKLVLAGDQ